jgi:ribosomal protein S27AE
MPFKRVRPPKPPIIHPTRQCPECGIPFTPNHGKRVYCGVRCAKRHVQRLLRKPPPAAVEEFWRELEEEQAAQQAKDVA